jgi:hypothetical protein
MTRFLFHSRAYYRVDCAKCGTALEYRISGRELAFFETARLISVYGGIAFIVFVGGLGDGRIWVFILALVYAGLMDFIWTYIIAAYLQVNRRPVVA